jgi:hypothetical protein
VLLEYIALELKVLKKQDFQRCDKNPKLWTKEGPTIYITWKEQFLSKEDIWEPIYIELEKKSLEQRKDGYPLVNNLRKKSHDKSN